MNLVVFSPSAFPQAQARVDNSVKPPMFGAFSQFHATQASPQNPLPGQRVITPATVANLLNPVAAGSASVNTSVMDTLVESTSQETLGESLRRCDPCSGRINESTGQGSLTQLPMILPAAQTVESRFSAAEYGGPGINTSAAIASVDDPEGAIGSYSVLPVENVGVGLPNTVMIPGNLQLGIRNDDSGRYYDTLIQALHEQQRYSEAVSDFGDTPLSAVFDQRQMSLMPVPGTYPSMEEVRLMLSDGPHFRIGMNELTMPEGDTLFRLVSSSSEPSTNSGSAVNNDTGYELKAESIAHSRMEPVPQVIEDLPSVCSSPAFPAMLADRAGSGQQRIPDTQDRKSSESANWKLNRMSAKKIRQLSNSGRYIIGFLFEELNLPDEERIIHWVIEDRGIFSKAQHINKQLANRWGKKKNNENMKYESFHRAIRSNYGNKHKAANIKHLVFGIDGKSPANSTSPLYQFNMRSQVVKNLFSLYKERIVQDEINE